MVAGAPDPKRAALEQKFRASALERLARALNDISELEEHPDRFDVIERVAREIHTVKGEARMLGFAAINEICHLVEGLFAGANVRGWHPSDNARALIAQGLDLVGALVHEPTFAPGRFAGAVDAYRTEAAPEIERVAASAPSGDEADKQAAAARARSRTTTAAGELLARAATARIPTEQLDALAGMSAGLLLRHAEEGRHMADLRRLAADVRRDAEIARHSDGTLANRLLALAKEMDATLARLVDKSLEAKVELRALQESVQAMRLLPLRLLFDAAPAAVRDLSHDTGKSARVVVDGADVSVDKQVLDVLDPVLVHLLRNALDHGLETADERVQAGKVPEGTVRLSARPHGGVVEIEVADDGRGLDVETFRAAAVRRGMMSEAEARVASDDALFSLAFEPGFTTRTTVTDLSGRGVGLDAVKREVQSLGGSVSLSGAPGKGARIRLSVPISVVLARALVVQIAEGTYAFASPSVDVVFVLDESAIEPAGDGRIVRVSSTRGAANDDDAKHRDAVPLFDLAALLGFPLDDGARRERVVVLRRGNERIAVAVARVVGERELAQRSVDAMVASVGVISGSAIIDGGMLVLAVNLGALFDASRRGNTRAFPTNVAAAVPPSTSTTTTNATKKTTTTAPTKNAVAGRKPRLLIVDDSELTRDMLVHLAARLGVEPWEAVDGHDALVRLEREVPDVVLTDLDMPVVDGVALIEAMRRSPRWREIPVIVLSTRGDPSDKKRAMDAGANAYLVKAAFHAEDLRRALDVYVSLPR